jgi:endopeptidase La
MAKKDLIKEILNQYLKSCYIWLCTRLEACQEHIERLYSYGVITALVRTEVMETLEELGRTSVTEYNSFSNKIREDQIDNIDLTVKQLEKCRRYLEPNNFLPILLPENIFLIDIFNHAKSELIVMGIKHGFLSFKELIVCFTELPYDYFLFKNEPIFKYLEDSLIITSVHCVKSQKDVGSIIFFEDEHRLETFRGTKICLEICYVKGHAVIVNGYFKPDPLNLKHKAGELTFPMVVQNKRVIDKQIREKYPFFEQQFITKYLKYSHSSLFFVKTEKQFVDDFVKDYYYYQDLIALSSESLQRRLSRGTLDNMYRMIFLLLLGNRRAIYNASFLFSILRDKKYVSNVVAQTIYHNLPYYLQKKLKNTSNDLRLEMERIKNIKFESIDIKKKIAANPDIPEDVTTYIMEKHHESMTNPDNAYKANLAIDALLKFPWKPKNADGLFDSIKASQKKTMEFMKSVAKKLDNTVYGHHGSKQLLLQLMGEWITNETGRGEVIGLYGPPGCGKTIIAQSISKALNIPFIVIKVGGMNDVTDLVGHGYTYATAIYGNLIERMVKAGKWRCVILFDEIDKAGGKKDHNTTGGDIQSQLVHITDPETNHAYTDRFFGTAVEFDLSGALMFCSYNDRDDLHKALLDRMHEIPVKEYSIKEKIEIVENFMLKEICASNTFNHEKIKMPPSAIRYIIEHHTREPGVRNLKRCLKTVLYKMNLDRILLRGPFRNMISQYMNRKQKQNMSKDHWKDEMSFFYQDEKILESLPEEEIDDIFNMKFTDPIMIDEELVKRYLKKPITDYTSIHKANLIGVVNGLYATSIGIGGIIPIQIIPNYFYSKNHSVKLKLTGNQGNDMIQSVTCAFNLAVHILSKAHKTNIIKQFPNGFSVHNPDISTPKDGPSAGCAFATAFVSILTGKKINRHISMTGELDATGKVTKIGGLSCKLHGAKKAGVKLVFISKENEDDYREIKETYPELFDGTFSVKIVEHIFEIISNKNVILGIKNSDFDSEVYSEFLKV